MSINIRTIWGIFRLNYFDNDGAFEIIEEHNYYPLGLKHKKFNDLVSRKRSFSLVLFDKKRTEKLYVRDDGDMVWLSKC
ncbi:MAG: hypothetical protein AAFX55_20230 [Bacteroidota bacterium]